MKAVDKVTVFQSDKLEKPITTIKAVPHSYAGWDNYKYNGTLYKGYYDPTIGAYILLTNTYF